MSELTVGALWRGWRDVLTRLGFETAALDAKLLAGHALGLSTLQMAMREAESVDDVAAARVADLLQRRLAGESVARIIGEKEFYGLSFGLNAATLEPRPDTELLVDLAIAALPPGGHLLDLGTGTGCIPIAVLVHRPDATALATDLSPGAIEMARQNAERQGVESRLGFAQGSWFEALDSSGFGRKSDLNSGRVGGVSEGAVEGPLTRPAADLSPEGRGEGEFDLVVSNPPYIASAVIEDLSAEVKDFDPRLALDGGPDGLRPYRIIAAEAARFLKPGGQVLVEIGYDQGESVSAIMMRAGFGNITVHKDLAGLDRVVAAHHMKAVDSKS